MADAEKQLLLTESELREAKLSIEKLNKDNVRLVEENNSYRFRMGKLESKRDKLEKTRKKLEDETRKTNCTVEDYRNENATLKDQLDGFIEDNKKFAHRVLELEHQTEELLNALEVTRNEKKRMLDDLQALEEEVEEKERSRKDYLERIRGLSQKVDEKESAKQAVEKTLDSVESQLSNYKRSTQELLDKVTFTKEVRTSFDYFYKVLQRKCNTILSAKNLICITGPTLEILSLLLHNKKLNI